jgi:hypothetical protein
MVEVSFKETEENKEKTKEKQSSSIAKVRLCFPPHHSLLQRAFLTGNEKEKKKKKRNAMKK